MAQFHKHSNRLDWVTYAEGELWWIGNRYGRWIFARMDENGKPIHDINTPVFRTRLEAAKGIPAYVAREKVFV